MDNKLSYRFLQNIPVGEDLFEGKSQEKIANVIFLINFILRPIYR